MRASMIVLLVGSGACGGHNDDGGGMVQGHALILKGAKSTTSAVAPRTGVAPAPADGYWAISPDQARITLTDLTFVDAQLQPFVTTLTDCKPTYKRTSDALSELLDCPFEVPPGTYLSVSIGASTTYDVLIDDAANGFFTTPGAATKLSTSGTGPGEFVSFTVPGPGGTGDVLTYAAYYSTPFVVAEGATNVSMQIVVDMTHTVGIEVSGGTATVNVDAPSLPAILVPSAGGAAKAEFYSGNSTAGNVMVGPVGSTSLWSGARVFYAEGAQPSFAWHLGSAQVANVDPAQPPWNTLQFKIGGYLAIDSTNTMCWAAATDSTWSTYGKICRMPLPATGSNMTTISCQNTAAPPAPTSGSTYAAGCPTITTPDSTETVYRVAN
jgi:hypothetical protein